MMDAFLAGGVMMWPIAAAGMLAAVFAVAAALRLPRDGRTAAVQMQTDAVLFWGAFALVAGVLGTTVGLYQMARVLEGTDGLDSAITWGGFKVTLITLEAGLLIFLVSLLLWFGLRFTAGRRDASRTPTAAA